VIYTVELNPSDPRLSGKYNAGDIVLVLCDATNGAFTVSMPSAKVSQLTLFMFEKIDSSGNTVTITPRTGETIGGSASKALSAQYEWIHILSDRGNYRVTGLTSGSGGIDGSGTADYVARWSDTDTLTTGVLKDDGSIVTVYSGDSGLSDDIDSDANLVIEGDSDKTMMQFLVSGAGSKNSILFSGDDDSSCEIVCSMDNCLSYPNAGLSTLRVLLSGYEWMRLDETDSVDAGVLSYVGSARIWWDDDKVNINPDAEDVDFIIESYFWNNQHDFWFQGSDGSAAFCKSIVGYTPTFPLEIHRTNQHPILAITAQHDTDYDPQIQFRTDSTPTVKWSVGVDAGDSDSLKFHPGEGVSDRNKVVFTQSGWVGIGTADPKVQLEVSSKNSVAIDLVCDSDDNESDTDAAIRFIKNGPSGTGEKMGDLRFDNELDIMCWKHGEYDSAGGALNIDRTNNVGVNTYTPASIFEILDDDANPILTITGKHDTDYDPQIQFRTDGTPTVKWSIGVDATNDIFFIHYGTGVGSPSSVGINTSGNVGIGAAPGTAKLNVNGTALLGDGGSTDYAEFESDGTLKFNGAAEYYEDIQFPIESGKVPAANFPTYEAFTTNTMAYAFSVDDYINLSTNEYAHWAKEEETGNFHVHLAIKTAQSTGANRYVKIEIVVAYADHGNVWTEASPISAELTVPDGSSALESFYLDIGDIDFSGYGIGTQIKCRVKRIAATGGTEYADDVYITQVGCHIAGDTIGSRTEVAK